MSVGFPSIFASLKSGENFTSFFKTFHAYNQAWNVLKNDVKFSPLFKDAKILGKPTLIKGEYLVTFGYNSVTFKVTLNKVADLQQIQVLGIK
jgi:hypothetical protein